MVIKIWEERVYHEEFINNIVNLVNKHGMKNSIYFDDTGLFYKIMPPKSICRKQGKGIKILRIWFLSCYVLVLMALKKQSSFNL